MDISANRRTSISSQSLICSLSCRALDVAAMQRSFARLMQRHAVFRTTFENQNRRSIQIEHKDMPLAYHVIDIRHLPVNQQTVEVEKALFENMQRPFDLRRDSLLRIVLIRRGVEDHLLAITTHHLVFDGWPHSPFSIKNSQNFITQKFLLSRSISQSCRFN